MTASDQFEDELYEESAAPPPGAPVDTHSPSQRASARKKLERIEQERIEVLQAMLSTKAGRQFIAWVLFDLCGFTAPTVAASGAHAFSDFRAGQRDVALKLHQMLRRADRSGYVALLAEHVDQI